MIETTVMNLSDGRELSFLEIGDPCGSPVVGFHGTPGSRLQMTAFAEAGKAAGVRLIAPDRPGYGHSTFSKDRHLADWASDVSELANYLGLGRFSLFGVSGGGPYAATCARFLGKRISVAGIVSGVGRLCDPASSREMDRSVQVFCALARRSRYLVYPLMATQAFVGRRWPDKAMEMALKRYPADAAVFHRPDVTAAMTLDAQLASATISMAAAQDFQLYARDWGFRLEDIEVPTHVWHGGADGIVPFAHGEQLASAIPTAFFHPYPNEGHMLAFEHMEEILRTVSEGARE